MSHFYTGSSDYTNGGNGQKIFCMAYGTSAAICASFHKNWQWHPWWSVVTAKNTARPEQRERGREGWGSNASIALLAGVDSSLHSFWCSNYKEKETQGERKRKRQKRKKEGRTETKRNWGCVRQSVNILYHRFVCLVKCVSWFWCFRMSSSSPLLSFFIDQWLKERENCPQKVHERCPWSGEDALDFWMTHEGCSRSNFCTRWNIECFTVHSVLDSSCFNDSIEQICREDVQRWKETDNTREILAPSTDTGGTTCRLWSELGWISEVCFPFQSGIEQHMALVSTSTDNFVLLFNKVLHASTSPKTLYW